MNQSLHLHARISEYLSKQISLRDLEDWLLPRLPSYLEKPDSADAETVTMLELSIYELGDGLIAEPTIRRRLGKHVPVRLAFIEFTEHSASPPQDLMTSLVVGSAITMDPWAISLEPHVESNVLRVEVA